MQYILKVLVLLLLSPAIALETQYPEIRLLSKLLRSIRKEQEVKLIFTLQHHRAGHCLIEDWNPRGIPIIRSDELSTFELGRNFNTFNSLAVLCIMKKSHYKLLNQLAIAFNNMRQERIIMWSQVRVTGKMLRKICRLADGHSFIKILILERVGNETVSAYRLNPFPNPKFERIEDILNLTQVFHGPSENFQGKTATVRPSKHEIFGLKLNFGPMGRFSIGQDEDRQIIEFALRKNLSLKFDRRELSDHFDFELSAGFVYKRDIENSVNPFITVTLIVVVPCGKERSILDVFKQLDISNWLLHMLVVYGAFVVVECLIHLVIHRITGRAYHFGLLNPLMNLRAFAAILGMSFPVNRRWSPLLRQLFLVLSIFGFVFSNFFACKLSALLTKHSRYAQVQNLEELRISGLPVAVNHEIRDYIVDHVDSEFFERVITTSKTMSFVDRIRMMVLFNDSFAYVQFQENWPFFDEYQTYMGRRVFCAAKNLTIMANLPRMHSLAKNSIYKSPLEEFSRQLYASGLQMYWKKSTPEMMRKALNVTIKPIAKQEAEPLSLSHFTWLWPLIIFGYGLATVVFLIEILWGGRRQRM